MPGMPTCTRSASPRPGRWPGRIPASSWSPTLPASARRRWTPCRAAARAWHDARDGGPAVGNRLQSDGSLAPGWSDQGVSFAGAIGFGPVLAPDGQNGMFLAWSDSHFGMPALIGLHVGGDAARAAGWPA